MEQEIDRAVEDAMHGERAVSATPSPLIEFPCDFPIKVLGVSQADFIERIIMAVRPLDPQFEAHRIEQRASRAGRYTGLTCTVYVNSRAHLDDIYRVLSAHPMVSYVL